MWRYIPLVLILYLCPAPALAQVPDATIQSVVNLNVKAAEIRYLHDSGQIDEPTWRERRDATQSDLNETWQFIGGFSAAEQNQARSQTEGLTKLRLETLQPGWDAKIAVARKQREQHNRAVNDAIPVDARAALELQRRRLSLQQRRDRGEITPEEFAVEDKKAFDGIIALRNKYVPEGQEYIARFDEQLGLLTQHIANNPPPAPEAKAVQANPVPGNTVEGNIAPRGTSEADYKQDVARAAMLYFMLAPAVRRNHAKQISAETYRQIEHTIKPQLDLLRQKWRAAGRGDRFQRDYIHPFLGADAAAKASARRNAPTQSSAGGRLGFLGIFSIFGHIFILSIAGIVGLYLLFRLLSRRTPAKGVSDVYGTAHYAPRQVDLADETCLANGVFFGKSSAPDVGFWPLNPPGAPVCSTPEHHTLIVARTRTGKGTRVIVPTLLRYAGSAFVIDPKGENAAITARVRNGLVQGSLHWVRILNPWNELAGTFVKQGLGEPATYNPLDILDRSDRNAVAVAQTLAGAICPAPSGGKDNFWQGSAANMLTAVFLWLADQPQEQKTLGRAREIVSLSRKDFTQKYLIPMAASEAFSGAIREMAAPFVDLAPETYSGVMANLSERTKFLSDPQVKASTAKSSFSMDDLVTHKSTVYVVIPTERMDAQKTWLRLIVASAMHTFKRPRKRGESRHRCLFLIDEFAALGRIDELPRDIATMGGFGVDLALVVQGLDQLKDHYGDARNTIISNCAYQWYCNLNDLESAKYLSEALGKKTVETTSTSDSTSSHGGSHGTSHGETARSLLNPDEILNLGKGVAILIQPKGHPHYLSPIDYWNLPTAFASLRESHPSLYWEPPLRYDKNPYVAPPTPPPPPPGSDGPGSGKKGKARSEPTPGTAKMTVDQARLILGVKAGATFDEIRANYLRLIKKIHPDLGGSEYFTKELNAAKAVLIGE